MTSYSFCYLMCLDHCVFHLFIVTLIERHRACERRFVLVTVANAVLEKRGLWGGGAETPFMSLFMVLFLCVPSRWSCSLSDLGPKNNTALIDGNATQPSDH